MKGAGLPPLSEIGWRCTDRPFRDAMARPLWCPQRPQCDQKGARYFSKRFRTTGAKAGHPKTWELDANTPGQAGLSGHASQISGHT